MTALRTVMNSKIHRATVTEADVNYIGSITIDSDLIDAANIVEWEKIEVLNITNGSRLQTYVIRGEKGSGEKIKTGMIFTIEPMINIGKYETKILNDGWTAVTRDKSLSAQFEHTIGVTNNGCEVFTQSNNTNLIL